MAILACGYILVYFSEHLFWAHAKPDDTWLGWILTWLIYSLTSYIFLSAIALFRLRSFWELFLAGAIFGWLTEGIIVQTVYEELPLSISFTGLAWHALISVCMGWYALRRAIQKSLWRTAWLSALIGLVYGFWAITWWVESDGMMLTPTADFFQFSFVATLFAILAYWLYDRCMPPGWQPSKWGLITAITILILYFLIITVPLVPLAAVILPLLLASVLIPLNRNRNAVPSGSMLDAAPQPHPIWRYLPLLLIPLIALTFYTLAYALEIKLRTNIVIYVLTTPPGFVLWIMGMVKLWRRKPVPEMDTA